MGVIVDDDVYPIAGVGIAASQTVTNAGPRVYVNEDVAVGWSQPWSTSPLCGAVGTVTATYDATNARVQLSGTGFDSYTSVLIERSTNQFSWTTVRGAAELTVIDGAFAINDYEFIDAVPNYYRVTPLTPFGCGVETVEVTPTLTAIWIKSLTRPFLNISIPVGCYAMGENDIELLVSPTAVGRRGRTALYPIVNRTYEIAITDLRLGRNWNVRLRSFTVNALKSIDFLLASGDVLLIQTPAGCPTSTIEAGYVAAMDASYTRHHRYPNRVVWEIPVVEVAAPGPDIAYAESTWQTVINRYGTWQDVLNAHSSWASLLTELPNPSEVIVP